MKPLGSLLLLADRQMFHEMGAGFREKRQQFDAMDVLLWILLPIGFFVVVGLLARLMAQSDKHQLFNSPRRLFRTLCRAHQLDRPARWLLLQIARAEGIEQPARLFLDPQSFRRGLTHPDLEGKRAAIEALAARLFPATSPPAHEPH
ncbi:MAG TPA: hypothetical protein VHY91_13705 [Pirellulales bacterium]|jgi:hypothetical protein|nr:hypothetical protein [Pirellulales bacterium]